MNTSIFLAAAGVLICSVSAYAGTVDGSAWVHGCGPRPDAVSLDLKNVDAYNKSIGAVNAYRQAQRGWLECIQNEGNADIRRTSQVISEYVNAEAKAAREANERLAADAKAAEAKFK